MGIKFLQEQEKFVSGKVLLFDKPLNWTSFDLVKKVKNILLKYLEIKKIKVGHAGTLDPLATGLLIICVGKATKHIQRFQNMDKEYVANIVLGKTTPSFDLETDFDNVFETSHITPELVHETIQQFIGEQDQIPPIFSAKNIKGNRAYHLARKGHNIEMKPSKIRVEQIEILNCNLPDISLKIRCGKGTYIRALTMDIGKALNSGAYLARLERTKIGDFQVVDAMNLNGFEKSLIKMKQI